MPRRLLQGRCDERRVAVRDVRCARSAGVRVRPFLKQRGANQLALTHPSFLSLLPSHTFRATDPLYVSHCLAAAQRLPRPCSRSTRRRRARAPPYCRRGKTILSRAPRCLLSVGQCSSPSSAPRSAAARIAAPSRRAGAGGAAAVAAAAASRAVSWVSSGGSPHSSANLSASGAARAVVPHASLPCMGDRAGCRCLAWVAARGIQTARRKAEVGGRAAWMTSQRTRASRSGNSTPASST